MRMVYTLLSHTSKLEPWTRTPVENHSDLHPWVSMVLDVQTSDRHRPDVCWHRSDVDLISKRCARGKWRQMLCAPAQKPKYLQDKFLGVRNVAVLTLLSKIYIMFYSNSIISVNLFQHYVIVKQIIFLCKQGTKRKCQATTSTYLGYEGMDLIGWSCNCVISV